MVDVVKSQIAACTKANCRMVSSMEKGRNLIPNRSMREAGKMMLKKAKES